MRQQEKKRKDKTALALVLCFSVVAIASVFTVKSGLDKIENQSNNILSTSPIAEQQVSKQIPTVDSKENTTKSSPKSEFAVPLSGKVIKEFSTETPIYSKTLDQYMVHSGIDIAAPKDTQVKAIADGTVTKVFTDDKMGISIEINHGNGITSVCSNLSINNLVEAGDVIKQGQVISGVGDTALFESLDESHLHFEILKDGINVNPLEYIKIRT